MKILCVLTLLAVQSAWAQNALWIDLSGEWKASWEDRAEFANPEFDDSAWKTFPLPTGEYQRTTNYPTWQRRTVSLPAGANTSDLAITVGVLWTDYELFVNGRKITSPAHLDAIPDEIPKPKTYAIPAGAVGGNTLVIALHRGPRSVIPPTLRLSDDGPYILSHAANAPADSGRRAIDRHRIESRRQSDFGHGGSRQRCGPVGQFSLSRSCLGFT